MTNSKKLNLAEIKERLAKATPGPWYKTLAESVECWFKIYNETYLREICSGTTWSNVDGPLAKQQDKDFELIANAPTDIAALVDALEKCENTLRQIDAGFNGMFGNPWVLAEKEALELVPKWVEETLEEVFGE